MISSHNRSLLITGAGRGIGAATAGLFYKNNFNVVMVSRTAAELARTAEDIAGGDNNRILHLAGDISEESFVTHVFAKAKELFGSVQVLINNAAILLSKDFSSHTTQEWDEVQRINVRGPFLCSRAFFQQFERPDPAHARVIVNISSLAGIQNTQKFPGLSSYVVSKFALTGLTEALALEGRQLGISVFGIAPGAVETDMLKKAAPHLKAGATPQDIARILLELANSSSCSMLTGTTIPLDTNL